MFNNNYISILLNIKDKNMIFSDFYCKINNFDVLIANATLYNKPYFRAFNLVKIQLHYPNNFSLQ